MNYDPGLADALSRVRFMVGDINPLVDLLPDETYTALLVTSAGDEQLAGRAAARALIARYSQEPSRISVNGIVTVDWGDRFRLWRELLAEAIDVTRVNAGAFRQRFPVRTDRTRTTGEYDRERERW